MNEIRTIIESWNHTITNGLRYVLICLIFPVGSPRRYSKIYLAFSQSSTMTSVGQFEWLLLYFIIASFGRNKGGEETNPKTKYITSWSIFIKRCQVAEYISISAFELLLCKRMLYQFMATPGYPEHIRYLNGSNSNSHLIIE